MLPFGSTRKYETKHFIQLQWKQKVGSPTLWYHQSERGNYERVKEIWLNNTKKTILIQHVTYITVIYITYSIIFTDTEFFNVFSKTCYAVCSCFI